MPLAFLLDEHFRGPLWQGVRNHNARGIHPIDVMRVGDPTDLPLGSKDPTILLWAEREQRVLVARDKRTLPAHLADHLATGAHSPGLFLVSHVALTAVVEFLMRAAYCSKPEEWLDKINFVP